MGAGWGFISDGVERKVVFHTYPSASCHGFGRDGDNRLSPSSASSSSTITLSFAVNSDPLSSLKYQRPDVSGKGDERPALKKEKVMDNHSSTFPARFGLAWLCCIRDI